MLHSINLVIKYNTDLLNLTEELSNVSKICKIMCISRDTLYCYRELADEGGLCLLINCSHQASNLKNCTDAATEYAVVNYSITFPALGYHRTSNELRKKCSQPRK